MNLRPCDWKSPIIKHWEIEMCRMNKSDLNYLTCTMRLHMGDYQAILRITQNKLTCAKKYCGRKKVEWVFFWMCIIFWWICNLRGRLSKKKFVLFVTLKKNEKKNNIKSFFQISVVDLAKKNCCHVINMLQNKNYYLGFASLFVSSILIINLV